MWQCKFCDSWNADEEAYCPVCDKIRGYSRRAPEPVPSVIEAERKKQIIGRRILAGVFIAGVVLSVIGSLLFMLI